MRLRWIALRAGSFRWFPYRPQSGLTWNALRAVFSTDCRSLGGEPVARVVCPLGPSAEAALRLARKMNAKFGACATSARQQRSQLSRRASEPWSALENQCVTTLASTEAGGTPHPAFGPGTRIGVARPAPREPLTDQPLPLTPPASASGRPTGPVRGMHELYAGFWWGRIGAGLSSSGLVWCRAFSTAPPRDLIAGSNS